MAQTSFRSTVSIAAILIIACFGLGYFVTYPQWTKYSLAKAQLAKLQSDNEVLNQDLAAIQSFLDSYKGHEKDVSSVNLALPVKSPDLANFAANIGELAKSSGVVLSNITLSEPATTASAAVSDNSIQVFPIALTASGTYASFKDFVIRLQKTLRLVDIGHVTLKADSNGLQYQINLKTYYQK